MYSHSRRPPVIAFVALGSLVGCLGLVGCTSSNTCSSDDDCFEGQICSPDDVCVAADRDTGPEATDTAPSDPTPSPEDTRPPTDSTAPQDTPTTDTADPDTAPRDGGDAADTVDPDTAPDGADDADTGEPDTAPFDAGDCDLRQACHPRKRDCGAGTVDRFIGCTGACGQSGDRSTLDPTRYCQCESEEKDAYKFHFCYDDSCSWFPGTTTGEITITFCSPAARKNLEVVVEEEGTTPCPFGRIEGPDGVKCETKDSRVIITWDLVDNDNALPFSIRNPIGSRPPTRAYEIEMRLY